MAVQIIAYFRNSPDKLAKLLRALQGRILAQVVAGRNASPVYNDSMAKNDSIVKSLLRRDGLPIRVNGFPILPMKGPDAQTRFNHVLGILTGHEYKLKQRKPKKPKRYELHDSRFAPSTDT